MARTYHILGHTFRLRAGDPAAQPALSHVRHLEADSGAAGELQTELELVRENGRWRLVSRGALVGQCSDLTGLVPLLHACAGFIAYASSGCLAAIHAAAVSSRGYGILLAGAPASGKTTLAVAMLKAGFGYVSDDTVLLSPPPFAVRGIPLPIGIKSGSWPTVARLWPGLDDLPVHERADGQEVRYFTPPGALTPGEQGRSYPVRYLLFPRYQAGHGFSARPLSTAQAMARLAASGYDVPGGLDRETLQHLLDWLSGLDCYEIEYGDSAAAVKWISVLVP